jgi:hypothetical protein
MNRSLLRRQVKNLFVKIKIFVINVLVKRIKVLHIFCVAIRVTKCKLSLLLLVPKKMLEHAFEVAIFSENERNFRRNSEPLFLIRSINRSVTLRIFGLI